MIEKKVNIFYFIKHPFYKSVIHLCTFLCAMRKITKTSSNEKRKKIKVVFPSLSLVPARFNSQTLHIQLISCIAAFNLQLW